MTIDSPAGAHDRLTELLESAREHARRGEADDAGELIETVETVAETELPDGSLKERLLHGCSEAATANGDEPLVAAEYLRAMADLVAGSDGDAEPDGDAEAHEDAEPDGDAGADAGESDDPDGEP